MPDERVNGEEATVLGLMKLVCRIRGVDLERRLRLLCHKQRRIARVMRAKVPPTAPPTSSARWECLVGAELEAAPATLLVTELTRVLWLPSEVTVWVMTIMLGLLEPGVDRLLLEGSFVGVVLVEGV